MDATLIRYGAFSSFAFNRDELVQSDKANWGVVPVQITSTTGQWTLAASNYCSLGKLLDQVDPMGNDHIECVFPHLDVYWFKVYLVRPDTSAYRTARLVLTRLADYPVIDEDDLSKREAEHVDTHFHKYVKAALKEDIPNDWKILIMDQMHSTEVHEDGTIYFSHDPTEIAREMGFLRATSA
jgi:hypothetical protein